MQLTKLLGSEEGREASQVPCQEASQPRQWQLEVGIGGCCQFLKDWCVCRAGHHVSGRKEAIFYPTVRSLMQRAAPEHQFCFAISQAARLPGYHRDPSDQLPLAPQVSAAAWLPKISHECVPRWNWLKNCSKLFSDMRFSLWTTQPLTPVISRTGTDWVSAGFFLALVLGGGAVDMIPNGWRDTTFSWVLYVCEGSKQHSQAGWAAAGVHPVPVLCCHRGGEVPELDCSAVIVQSNVSHGLDCCPGPSASKYDEVASIFHLLFFSFPQNLSYRTCQKEKTASFPALRRHMDFSVSRRRNLAKTVFSYSPCHSWNLLLQCVCRDSTAVPWSINAFK